MFNVKIDSRDRTLIQILPYFYDWLLILHNYNIDGDQILI